MMKKPISAQKKSIRKIQLGRTKDAEVLYCHVPIDVKKRFKLKAYREGKSMTNVIRELVDKYLEG